MNNLNDIDQLLEKKKSLNQTKFNPALLSKHTPKNKSQSTHDSLYMDSYTEFDLPSQPKILEPLEENPSSLTELLNSADYELNLDQLDLISDLRQKSIKLYQKANYSESIKKIDDALKIIPNDLELLYQKSLCLFRLKNYARALIILNQLECFENSHLLNELPKIKSIILLRQEKFVEAEKYLRNLISYQVNDLQFLNMLAYSLERQNKDEEAQKILEQILQKSPKNVNAANSLAYIWVKNYKNLNQATELIRIALEKEGDNPNYIDTLAVILARKGNKEGAKKAWKKALKLTPNSPYILSNMRSFLN